MEGCTQISAFTFNSVKLFLPLNAVNGSRRWVVNLGYNSSLHLSEPPSRRDMVLCSQRSTSLLKGAGWIGLEWRRSTQTLLATCMPCATHLFFTGERRGGASWCPVGLYSHNQSRIVRPTLGKMLLGKYESALKVQATFETSR